MVRVLNVRPSAWSFAVWGGIIALILTPLAAMKFTTAVAWTSSDFAAAAALLGVAGLLFEAISRSSLNSTGKLALLAFVVATTGLIWAQGAVGVF